MYKSGVDRLHCYNQGDESTIRRQCWEKFDMDNTPQFIKDKAKPRIESSITFANIRFASRISVEESAQRFRGEVNSIVDTFEGHGVHLHSERDRIVKAWNNTAYSIYGEELNRFCVKTLNEMESVYDDDWEDSRNYKVGATIGTAASVAGLLLGGPLALGIIAGGLNIAGVASHHELQNRDNQMRERIRNVRNKYS